MWFVFAMCHQSHTKAEKHIRTVLCMGSCRQRAKKRGARGAGHPQSVGKGMCLFWLSWSIREEQVPRACLTRICVCAWRKKASDQPELFRMDLGGGHRDWKPACLRLVLPGPRWPSTLAKQKKKGTSRSPTRKLESHRHPFGVVPEGKCHNKGSSRQSSWMMCFYGVLSKPISMQTGWKAKREKGHVLPHTLPRPGWFR